MTPKMPETVQIIPTQGPPPPPPARMPVETTEEPPPTVPPTLRPDEVQPRPPR